MNQNTKKILKRIPNCAAVILCTIGFCCAVLATGTEDYRTEVHNANIAEGYEKYPEDEIASPETTKNMALFGIAALCVAAGIGHANKKSR